MAGLAIITWATLCWLMYTNAVEKREQELRIAVSFVEEHLERSLDGPALILKQVSELVIESGGIDVALMRPADWRQIETMDVSLPQVYIFVVADSDGVIRYNSTGLKNMNLDISDRPYFAAHKIRGEQFHIGAAIRSRIDNVELFTISRSIIDNTGRFLGVAVMGLRSDYFRDFFLRESTSDLESIALISRSGDVLVKSGVDSSVGMNLSKSIAFRDNYGTQQRKIMRGSVFGSEDGVFALRMSEEYAILISASIPMSVIQEEVFPSLIVATAILVILLGVIGGFGYVVFRGLSREEKLKQEYQKLSYFRETILENARLPIIVCDTNGDVVFFNRAAEVSLGYTSDEAVDTLNLSEIADPITPVFCEDDKHGDDADANTPCRTLDLDDLSSRQGDIDSIYRRKDGSIIPVALSVSKLRTDADVSVGYVVIARDQSAQKSAERALRFSEQRQRAILDNIVDGIFTININGIVSSMNPAAERIFGYEGQEILGRNISVLMDDAHRGRHDGYVRRYMQMGDPRIIGRGREVPGRRKDGSVFPLDLAVSRVDFAGRTMFVGVVRDLSETKKVERLKSEFVSIVSHELRTPLTAMRGALNIVNSEVLGPLDAEIKELTQIAEQSTERLIRLINDILDVEKIGSGKLTLKYEAVSIRQSMDRSLQDIESYAEQYGVSVVTEMTEDYTVWADFDRLQQIILNLLSNAVKFSPKGETVRLVAECSADGWVRLLVVDKGPGIAVEFHDQIFEKFAQADASDKRAKGGTGLGLSITKGLAEQMGGSVGFESQPGEGTTFYVDLPIMRKSEEPSADRRSLHILHLEDDEGVRLIISHMLSERARITGAESVAAGISLAEKHAFDLAILDMGLPDGNGLEVVDYLKNDQGDRPALIILSGHEELPPDAPSVAAVLVKTRESERATVDKICAIIDRLFPVVPAEEGSAACHAN
ncbi:PAS domain S-box protein [Roseospira visakhapatnamensis]|uniref:Sensor protein FixL n=1 Tax=Roseospira visakhapatnamensis TaxID=390880 RepID=A0A7W6WA03_9PROT|nr:PAS domain S-box protein [Roseospira visakhapatnamensis]MBB4266494.1 PAS domain S-box-containing protein [Roseospira visakhapatnamensis]